MPEAAGCGWQEQGIEGHSVAIATAATGTKSITGMQRIKGKPTGNSELKSALKSLLFTSSKIPAVPESMLTCSIIP